MSPGSVPPSKTPFISFTFSFSWWLRGPIRYAATTLKANELSLPVGSLASVYPLMLDEIIAGGKRPSAISAVKSAALMDPVVSPQPEWEEGLYFNKG